MAIGSIALALIIIIVVVAYSVWKRRRDDKKDQARFEKRLGTMTPDETKEYFKDGGRPPLDTTKREVEYASEEKEKGSGFAIRDPAVVGRELNEFAKGGLGTGVQGDAKSSSDTPGKEISTGLRDLATEPLVDDEGADSSDRRVKGSSKKRNKRNRRQPFKRI